LGEVVSSGLYFRQFWWGTTGVPNTTNAIASTVAVPCQVVSGNDDYGTAVPICGSADDPCPGIAQVSFNLDGILPVTSTITTEWKMRISWDLVSSAAGVAAGRYSETLVFPNLVGGLPSGNYFPVNTVRIPVTYIVWVEGWSVTNLATMDFYWACHGHPS
jgi:hypothetical protein